MPRIDESLLFAIAPMAEVTTSAFRRFARLLTRRAMLYTEMVSAEAVCRGRLDLLDFSPEELPCTLQLGGADPRHLAEAAALGEQFGYSAVNLNAGCPSVKAQSGIIGAALMKDLKRLTACLEAMQNAVTIPVSVKTRIGVDHETDEAFTQALVTSVLAGGCRQIILHARPCRLHGLSPKENRLIPPLNYDRVYWVKTRFPQLHVTINGGIGAVDDCFRHLNHVDAVMLGRAVCRNPFMLHGVDSLLFDDREACADRTEVFARLLDLAETYCREGHKLKHLARCSLNLFNSCPGVSRYRRYLSAHLDDTAGPELLARAYAVSFGDGDPDRPPEERPSGAES